MLREAAERANAPPEIVVPDVPRSARTRTRRWHSHALHRRIEWVNIRVGEFVAYWAVISVFGYYYEVIARFAFNSPTNWLHESMFLMYGMQYMLPAPTPTVRPARPRRRVLHEVLDRAAKPSPTSSPRCSSSFSSSRLLWTSWRFAMDSLNPGGIGEVSFTEWGVQYWPVKLMMPIGAALLLLQGLSKLIKDIVILTRGRA